VTIGFPGTVPVDIGRDDAAAAARDELAKPVYAAHRPSLTQQVVDWVGHLLSRVLQAITSVAPGGIVGLVVIALVLALVVAIVAFRVGPLRTTAAADRVVFAGAARSAAEHRADAERAAAAGDWDEAVRQRFRALVRALEERDVLDERPGRTADEAAADTARSMPASATELVWAARRFDDVAYGDQRASDADYRRLVALDNAAARTPVVVA
jgi:hypothetical protein